MGHELRVAMTATKPGERSIVAAHLQSAKRLDGYLKIGPGLFFLAINIDI